MKVFKYLSILLVALLTASCEKHEIEYNTEIADGAFVQIHYFVPLKAATANNIYKLEIGDNTYVNNSAAVISTYNGTPPAASATARWYNVTSDTSVPIKLYMGTGMELVYNNVIPALKKGVKYNIFIHDFDKEPLVIEHGEYDYNTTEDSDEACWIKFINLVYETGEGDPTNLSIQYQFQYTTDVEAGTKSEWLDMGGPVAFGEDTGWIEMPVKKSIFNSSGYARIDYRALDAATGEILQYMNSSGKMTNYSDYWNGYIGRRYMHIMAGTRTATTRALAVSQWTAL